MYLLLRDILSEQCHQCTIPGDTFLSWGIGNSFRSGKVDQKGPCAFLLLIGVMTKIYLTLYQMLFVASNIACTASPMDQWCVSEWALNALYVIASRSDVWRCCSSRE